MTFESKEVAGNGPEKNFAECPCCGQKLLSVALLEGEAKIVVKCRRCHKFIQIQMAP